MKEHLEFLDSLHVNLTQGGMLLVNFILAFVMFGVALGIKVRTFKSVFKKPTSVIIGLLAQWIALPAFTCLLAIVLNPIITPMVAIGMILVASCPGGNMSNFLSAHSKGNVELSVSMTAITTVFASVITPLNFWFWGSHYLRFAEIKKALILGFPIVLGLLVSHYFPNFAKKLVKPTSVLSIILFIGMVAVSLSQVLSSFEQRWEVYAGILVCLLVVVIHNAMALGTGYYGAKMGGVPVRDRRSLTIETGIQNSGLGLALLLNPAIFPPEQWKENGGMIIVTALWGIWHIVTGLTISTIFRRSPLKE